MFKKEHAIYILKKEEKEEENILNTILEERACVKLPSS